MCAEPDLKQHVSLRSARCLALAVSRDRTGADATGWFDEGVEPSGNKKGAAGNSGSWRWRTPGEEVSAGEMERNGQCKISD